MSQNRGMRRDRPYRSGGGYGGGGGERSGGMGRVHPWEGGMVPGLGLGGGGGPRGSSGLLPTPSNQASSLLSQLASPDAQLILASNLLSSLLRPQQSQQQAPPLLSLNSLSGGPRQLGSGLNLGPGGPRGFQERRWQPGNRRNEPYNRPGNWSRDSQNKRSQSGGPDHNRSTTKSSNLKSSLVDKKSDETKDRQTGEGGEDAKLKRESGDEKDVKKDRKDEKREDKNKEPPTEYAGIPEIFLYCHICRKHMWDEHSFHNHVRGRAHQLIVEKMEENYKIKVELMRHEMKVAEQRREIELERLKRHGRNIYLSSQEYCTMCDLNFLGYLIAHRKTARHQKLKAFLHPHCDVCNKEFPTRIEWDKHRVTAIHMKKVTEAHKGKTFDLESDDFDLEEFGCLDNEIYDDDNMERSIIYRSRDSQEAEDIGDAEKAEKEKEKEEKLEEDIKSGGAFRLPKYTPEVPVGQTLLKSVEGHYCRVCRRFFLSEDVAFKTHCRTLTHYNNYVSLMKLKVRLQAVKERREAGEEKGAADGDEAEDEPDEAEDEDEPDEAEDEAGEENESKPKKRDIEDKDDTDDTGNWKRRRTAKSSDNGADVKEGGELYDPMNPSEDAENPSPEANGDSKEWAAIDKLATDGKEKILQGDESLWDEVDRDIGSLLNTVDQKDLDNSTEDAVEEKVEEEEEEQEKQTRGRTKSNTGRGGNTAVRGNSGAIRGRRRK